MHPLSLLADFVKSLISTSCCSQGWSLFSSAQDNHMCSPRASRLQQIAAARAPLHRAVQFSLPPSLSQLLPFHILLPVFSAASTACTPFKPPSCRGDIWHRPWFATRASPPTHPPDSCLPKCEDVLHSESVVWARFNLGCSFLLAPHRDHRTLFNPAPCRCRAES